MQTFFHFMPVDRTTIQTRLRINPEFLRDPSAFIHRHNIAIRTSKPSRGRCKRGSTINLSLDVLTYKGIHAKLRKVSKDPLTDVTIHFNPGVCLYGHNGSVPSLSEFQDALALLVTSLTPLLSDPNDQVDLVPGLRSVGVAYRDYLEILFQSDDPYGKLLAGFRHARHPDLNSIPRHWPESIVLGGKRSELKFEIYRKAVEMVARGKLPKEQLADHRHVLRLEVRLKSAKLVEYLGNERNVEEIDGKLRLVRFYPHEVIGGQRDCFNKMMGVYHSAAPLEAVGPKNQLIPLGRFLARTTLDPLTSMTLPELLARIKFCTGASSETISNIRKAGMAMLSHQSTLSKDDLFSDDAYQMQYSIRIEKRENMVRHDYMDTIPSSLIFGAYTPPDHPDEPLTQWPSYLSTR